MSKPSWNRIDMVGFRSGKLVAIEEQGKIRGEVAWLCTCDCGNKTVVAGSWLRSGHRTSCGHCTNIGQKMKKHGMYNTKLYRAWGNMKARCYRKSTKQFYDYGGRGITVCEEWRNSFPTFMEWALSNGYSEELTLDRIDVNGNYEPSNCRWATHHEQQMNRRCTKHENIRPIQNG